MSTVTPIHPSLDVKMSVAGEVRAWMGRRGINQAQLANALGLQQSAISKRLRGTITFDVEELAKAAQFLGCEVSDFFPRRSGDTPPSAPIATTPERQRGLTPSEKRARLSALAAKKHPRGVPTDGYAAA